MIVRTLVPYGAVLPLFGRGGLVVCAALALGACGAPSPGNGDDGEDSAGAVSAGAVPVHAPLGGAPAPEDGQGTVRITPADPVPVGSRGTWSVEWVAGPAGLPTGGGAVLQVSPFWGWSQPQARRAGKPGYTTVRTSGAARLEVAAGQVPMTLVVRVVEGRLAPGDTLRFVYGDTAGGPGGRARVDTYAEAREELLIKTDGNGDGWFVALPDQPGLRILPGPVARLTVSGPVVVAPGEAFEVRVAAMDVRENRTAIPAGRLEVTALPLRADADEPPRETVQLASQTLSSEEDVVVLMVAGRIPEGLWRLEARTGDLVGRNGLLLVERADPFGPVLWGDLHVHSALSDGTGSPRDLYAYARDVAGLDVCSVTDHDAHGLFPLAERGGWDEIREATRNAYVAGRFVTLLGYEWTSWTWGHRNVYYPDLEGEVFSFLDPDSDSPAELWERIAAWDGRTIPHHPGGGPVPIDWSVAPDPERETVVEICSIHGSSEAAGTERGIYRPVAGASVRDALSRGYRLGILASGDTHDGHPGRRTAGAPANGLAAFRTGDCTREGILAALDERRVYGTSGARILLASDWGGFPAGAAVPRDLAGPITVEVAAPEPVRVIEIVGPEGVIAREWGGGRRVGRTFGLTEVPAWAYVRVVLGDGEIAWDSPWWPEEES